MGQKSEVHPAILLVVGLVVSGVSYFQENFVVFLYVGLLIAAYGGIKLGIAYTKGRKSSVQQPSVQTHHASHVASTHQHQSSHQNTAHQHAQQFIHYCPQCRARVVKGAYFCYNCGSRLR